SGSGATAALNRDLPPALSSKSASGRHHRIPPFAKCPKDGLPGSFVKDRPALSISLCQVQSGYLVMRRRRLISVAGARGRCAVLGAIRGWMRLARIVSDHNLLPQPGLRGGADFSPGAERAEDGDVSAVGFSGDHIRVAEPRAVEIFLRSESARHAPDG